MYASHGWFCLISFLCSCHKTIEIIFVCLSLKDKLLILHLLLKITNVYCPGFWNKLQAKRNLISLKYLLTSSSKERTSLATFSCAIHICPLVSHYSLLTRSLWVSFFVHWLPSHQKGSFQLGPLRFHTHTRQSKCLLIPFSKGLEKENSGWGEIKWYFMHTCVVWLILSQVVEKHEPA